MKKLLVFGAKTFKITVPADSKITFGPWSPPAKGFDRTPDSLRGTLRIYSGTNEKNILACFADVTGFRDLTLDYAEQVAKEEGATIWKDDREGYQREEKVKRTEHWVSDVDLLPGPTTKRKGKSK